MKITAAIFFCAAAEIGIAVFVKRPFISPPQQYTSSSTCAPCEYPTNTMSEFGHCVSKYLDTLGSREYKR